MHVVINTPSSHIGRPLTERLLGAGTDVTIISRNREKVKDLVERGARLVAGSIDDESVVARATEHADLLFWLTPPVIRPDFPDWARATARTAAKNARSHGVARAVVLSSIGAQHPTGTGPVAVLHDIEDIIAESIGDAAMMRPAFFMENFLEQLEPIREHGAIFMPVGGDRAFPMVATRDIAARTAEVVLDDSWSGRTTYGVHGPEDLTLNRAAAIIGQELGREIKYVQTSFADTRESLLQMGLPEPTVDLYLELYRGMTEGRLDAAEPRTNQTTTSTSLAEFTRIVMRPALGSAASG